MRSLRQTLSELDVSRRYRLVALYLLGLMVMVLLFTIFYNLGMGVFEGDSRSIFHSFQIVIETMTTTGYGADSPWETPVMNLFVVFMQLSGIAIAFFTLRLIVIPLFTSAEPNLDNRLSPKRDHVIICEYRRDSAVLLDELENLGFDYVLISPSREEAVNLSKDGYAAIHGSPEKIETFERASIDTASAVVTDAGEATVGSILTVRAIDPDMDLIALTDDSELREIFLETGADCVLSPHRVLGKRLAEKAVSTLHTDLSEAVPIGNGTELAELQVQHGSPLVGTTLRESGLRERTGVNVIGAWIDGELEVPPDPQSAIRPNTVLIVSGTHDSLESLTEVTRPARKASELDRVVIAGYGEVGKAAAAVIEDAGLESMTIDTKEQTGVDVVGNAGSRETLDRAEIDDAGAIIVGVPDDSTALLTTVLARSMRSTIEILTRIKDTESSEKAIAAGADYVLSVPRVSARMLATELRGEDRAITMDAVELIEISAAPFEGTTLADSGIAETGCRVVTVRTAEKTQTEPDPSREFTGSETLAIVGTGESIEALREQFGIDQA
ncbi:MAG: NAD-binding protein [Halodesulfurarchaeum sp.]|nr:NAD-binding protein [Halodesulfurarchaeum sp.]